MRPASHTHPVFVLSFSRWTTIFMSYSDSFSAVSRRTEASILRWIPTGLWTTKAFRLVAQAVQEDLGGPRFARGGTCHPCSHLPCQVKEMESPRSVGGPTERLEILFCPIPIRFVLAQGASKSPGDCASSCPAILRSRCTGSRGQFSAG